MPLPSSSSLSLFFFSLARSFLQVTIILQLLNLHLRTSIFGFSPSPSIITRRGSYNSQQKAVQQHQQSDSIIPNRRKHHKFEQSSSSSSSSSLVLHLFAQKTKEESSDGDKPEYHQQQQQKELTIGQYITKRRTWDESYYLLVEYYQTHGDCNVPRHYKNDPKLGYWVAAQRRRQGQLKADKITKLNELNFSWDGSDVKQQLGDEKWEEMFLCLEEYKKEYGHCNVPGECLPNQELANWVQSQRKSKTNSVTSLTPYRIKKLESIGFQWRLLGYRERQSDVWDKQWENKFNELLLFQKQHGHCNVPGKYKPNQSLADWVKRQREMNSGGHVAGDVRTDRKERLDKVDFVWDFEEIWDEVWLNMYNQLKKEEEKASISSRRKSSSSSLKDSNFNNVEAAKKRRRQTWANAYSQAELWAWEIVQQNSYLRGTMDSQREALLEDIGYWKSLGFLRNKQ